jgi:hypothetical protein
MGCPKGIVHIDIS